MRIGSSSYWYSRVCNPLLVNFFHGSWCRSSFWNPYQTTNWYLRIGKFENDCFCNTFVILIWLLNNRILTPDTIREKYLQIPIYMQSKFGFCLQFHLQLKCWYTRSIKESNSTIQNPTIVNNTQRYFLGFMLLCISKGLNVSACNWIAWRFKRHACR